MLLNFLLWEYNLDLTIYHQSTILPAKTYFNQFFLHYANVIQSSSQTSYPSHLSSLINHSNKLVSLSYQENRGHRSNCPQLPLSTMPLIQIYQIRTHVFLFPSSGRRECSISDWKLVSTFMDLKLQLSRDLALASIPFLLQILNLSLPRCLFPFNAFVSQSSFFSLNALTYTLFLALIYSYGFYYLV